MKHYSRVLAGLFLVVPLGLVGCGGGGSNGPSASRSTGGTAAALTGDVAAQAAIVSSYQAFQGGVNYPFAQVQATLPSGSAFKAALRAALQKRAAAHGLTAHTGATADGIGLYSATSTSGAGATLNFYTDAAETQSAGSLTITQTAPATTSLTLGTYTSYPVDFAIAANVTSGPLPCTGSGTIALTDSAGAGEIKGNITLPATNVTANADLTLDDSGTIGGTVTVNEKAQTLTLTGLSGGLAGAITGNVTVAPGGDTGTATLNIASGTFAVTLNTPTGTATGTSNSSGGLDITLPSGASETISSPLTASPTAPVTTTGTGTGTGTTIGGGSSTGLLALDVAALFPFADWQPDVSNSIPFNVLINDSNQVLEQNSNTQLIYITSANALGTSSLITSLDSDPIALAAFNNAGEFVANTQSQQAIYVWASPTATPTTLAFPAGAGQGSAFAHGVANALSNSGEIVGSADLGNVGGFAETLVWANAAAIPTVLLPLNDTTLTTQGYTLSNYGSEVSISGPSGADTYTITGIGSTTSASVTGGQANLVLTTVIGSEVPVALSPGTYSGTFTATQAGQQVASFPITLTIGDTSAVATGVNANGLIVGISSTNNSQSTLVYWTSGSRTAHALPAPSGADAGAFSTLGVNDKGQIYGNTNQNSAVVSSHIYTWSSVTARPTQLPDLGGGAAASAINASGTIAGFAVTSSGQYHAVIWKNGQITDLQSFGNPGGGVTTINGIGYNTLLSSAMAINDNGIVVGFADLSPFALRLQ